MGNKVTSRQRGIALITTLVIIILLSFTLFSFITLVNWQKIRSKSFLEKIYLQSISDLAEQEALAKIADGCEFPWQTNGTNIQAAAHLTACPGLMSIRYFHSNTDTNSPFSATANPRLIPLFSWSTNSNSLFNLNTPRNPFYPGEFYLTGYPESSNAPIYVQWLPVYKNPAAAESETNPIVGRYAYWVDVENSKINLRLSTRPSTANTNTNSDATAFSWWFDWLGNMRPRIADNSLLDWNAIIGTNVDSSARARLLSSLTNYFIQLENGQTNAFNFWPEIYSLWSYQDTNSDRTLLAIIRKTLATKTTLYGCDDERDPLGREKISLLKFQREYSLATNNLFIEALNRLANVDYGSAYLPTQDKSFAYMLNAFNGNGIPNNTNFSAAKQILVNIAESQYDYTNNTNPLPYISENEGIVAARAMPYVQEVSTRARSALYLLNPSDRKPSNFITNGKIHGVNLKTDTNIVNINITTNSLWFLTNVIVEIQMKPSRYYMTNRTNWNFMMKITNSTTGNIWDTTASALFTNTVNFPVEFSRNSKIVSDYLYLGILPGPKITNAPTALRISGWEIAKTNQIFHKVPIKHIGQSSSPLSWWEMAKAGVNVGNSNHTNSFYEFQSHSNIAVGWFPPSSWTNLTGFGTNRIFISGTNIVEGNTNPTAISNVTQLINSTTTVSVSAIFSHIYCKDTPLGHRTGNTNIWENNKRGHFYGSLGHPWRYRPNDQSDVPKEKLAININNEDVEVHKEVDGFKLILSDDTNTISDYTESRGYLMTSVGEIGYVNSGMLGILMAFFADSKNSNSLNCSDNGPPLRMIFDLFTPGAFWNNDGGSILSKTDWGNQNVANTAASPRRGTWNVNTQWVSLDENGNIKVQHPLDRGFDVWLKFLGSTSTNYNTSLSLAHFNSDAFSNFSLPQREPMGVALVANQMSTAANAFTIHIVAQTLKEIAGKNFVTGERWTQVVVGVDQDTTKINSETGAPYENRYHVLYYRAKNGAK